MSDLIDRAAAIEALEEKYFSFGIFREQRAASQCIDVIKHLPSAQPEKPLLTVRVDIDEESLKKAIEKIKNEQVAIMPERKTGKWIKHEVKRFDGFHTGRFFDECSECGKLTPEWRKITEYHRWNYCPNCGAEMEREE